MGGFGSGRQRKHPVIYEETCRLDIRQLNRHDGLNAGCQSAYRWYENGIFVKEVWIEVSEDKLAVLNRYLPNDNPTTINLERTRCHFGGSRVWLQCPCCKRRCAVLIAFREREFACRTCLHTPYETQRMTKHARAARKRNFALAKLESARRQAGLWKSTIEKLEDRYTIANYYANQALVESFQALLNDGSRRKL